MLPLLFVLPFLQDPIQEATAKIEKELASASPVTLGRTFEIIRLIRNEGTFLESQKRVPDQAVLYERAAERLAQVLEAQARRSPELRKVILSLTKARRRAAARAKAAEKVWAYRFSFDEIGLIFELACARAKGWLGLGLEYLRGERGEEASEALRRADDCLPALLGVDPRITDQNLRLIPLVLAQSCLARGNYASGGKAARRSVPLLPDQRFDLRSVHGEKANYDSYLRKLQEHARNNPRDLDARFLLGYQLFFSPDPSRAKGVFRSLLERTPDDKEAKYFADRLR